MFKLVIADDNALTREALRTSFLWKSCGFELVGEAENGKAALDLLEKERPDAALIDIKMPVMTGLEVIEQSGRDGNPCLFVILSAYDDFSFAQQGVKLGVFDYLLKPIDDEELRKVLHRLYRRLKEKENKAREFEILKKNSMEADQKIKKTDRELKSKLLGDSVNGIKESTELLEDILKQDWHSKGFELMLLAPDGEERTTVRKEPGAFIRYVSSLLRSCEKLYSVKLLELWRSEGLLVLIVYQKICFSRDYDLLALKIARRLYEESQKGDRKIFISISGYSEKLQRLPEAFREVLLAYSSRFFFENSNIIHYGSMKSKSVRNEYLMGKKMQEVYEAFDMQPEELTDKLEEFFCMVSQEAYGDVQYVKNIFVQLSLMLSYMISRKYPDFRGIKDAESIMSEVDKICSMNEMFDWLRKYVRNLLQTEKEEHEHLSAVSRKAMDFLNVHYMDRITLTDVAEAAGVSESHLCRCLKQDTGETFVNLLNKIRIQKAIRLLREGDFKVYEIAELVGFRNYAYFYQLFKKMTGCAPTEFQ